MDIGLSLYVTQRGWSFSVTRAGTRAAEASSAQWSQCISTFFMLQARSHFCDVVRAVGASRDMGTQPCQSCTPMAHRQMQHHRGRRWHGLTGHVLLVLLETFTMCPCMVRTLLGSAHAHSAFLTPRRRVTKCWLFSNWLSWSLACLSCCDTGGEASNLCSQEISLFYSFLFLPTLHLSDGHPSTLVVDIPILTIHVQLWKNTTKISLKDDSKENDFINWAYQQSVN